MKGIYKTLWGSRVHQIEKNLGKPLEDVLTKFDEKGLSFREQAVLLGGVSPAHVGIWRNLMGLKVKPLKKKAKNLTSTSIVQKYDLAEFLK
jgi:hypothetical protein